MEKMVDITDSKLYFFKNYVSMEIVAELWVNGSLFHHWDYDDMPEQMQRLANQSYEE